MIKFSPTLSGGESRAMKSRYNISYYAVTATVLLALFALPALAHHSFAMYDQTKTVTWTGVTTSFAGQANHAEMHFIVIAPDGKPMKDPKDPTGKAYVTWGVEMAGAAAVAQEGITATTFAASEPYSSVNHGSSDAWRTSVTVTIMSIRPTMGLGPLALT